MSYSGTFPGCFLGGRSSHSVFSWTKLHIATTKFFKENPVQFSFFFVAVCHIMTEKELEVTIFRQ